MVNEMVRYTSLGIDLIMISTFVLVGIYGYRREYRQSIVKLSTQLLSILLSGGLTFILGQLIMSKLPEEKLLSAIKNLLPENLTYLIQPIETYLIGLIIYSLLFIIFFVFIKSFLAVFSKNYHWSQYVFKKATLHVRIEKIISVLATLLTAYTYMVVFALVIGFPVLNVTQQQSFSRLLIKSIPDFSNTIQTVYQEYDAVNEAVQVYGEYVNDIYDGTKINFNEIKNLIDNEAIEASVIEKAYEQLIPQIANEESYLSYFEGDNIEVPQMSQYIRTMTSYIESGVITLEIFNSYYKELIDNGTYGKLIQDEVISTDSLQLLIQSNLLNEDNVEKINEY
ncbi:MAG TPA: hypothetical protein DCY20_04270 [Firmicutes bacterium]|nr:hypothetical protein [Bacillota bacterium]